MKKSILVIGGNSTIGTHIIRDLTGKGHSVTTLSREPFGEEIEGVTSHILDITTDEIPAEYIPDALDGLVYMPGTINLKPFRALKPEVFREDIEINFMGAVKAIQAALKNLKSGSHPAIVLFSTVAVQTGMPFHSSIASAKGAVEGLTRSLAAEFAPDIRVNCIAPSLTRTKLAGRLIASDEKVEASAKRHPLNRIGEPEEIAKMALFLLEEDSSWMTGQIITMDGGIGSLKS